MASTPDRQRSRLILASASAARAALLLGAGVSFAVEPADIDEAAIKRRHWSAGGDAEACAMALALAKAVAVSARHPDALVIGADQLLVADGDWFDKPADLAEAAMHLRRLRGRTHELVTGVCAVQGQTRLWQAVSTPRLTMRRFGEGLLAEYIAAEENAVLGSVGAYRIEGRGAQFFTRIEGDYFAILGLPLIELLGFLRERDLVGE